MSNVLIIGPDFFGYNESISNAFKNNNWNTDVINYFDGRSMSFTQLISSVFKPNYFFDINKLNISIDYDLILVIKGTKISNAKVDELRKYSKSIYLWIMDPIKLLPEINEKLSLFDKVFTFQKSDIKLLSKTNCKTIYLPLFYDDNIFGITRNKKPIDFIFIGNLYEQRAKELNQFCKLVTESDENLNIQIYGGFGLLKILNYIRIKKQFKYLSRFLKFGLISPRKSAKLYSNSKVGINIHVRSQTGLNMRFFELLGSGITQILPNCNIELNEINIHKDSYICNELKIKEVVKILNSYVSKESNTYIVNHSSTNRIKEIIDEFNS